MKIGFCGTMSVGKTTLVNALKELPEFKDYTFRTERSKYLMEMGIPLNTDSTYKGQLIFTAERAAELMQEKIITDRTVIDVMAFSNLSTSMKEHEKFFLSSALIPLIDEYDVLFYVSPEGVEIENNGIRETNAEYRMAVDREIRSIVGMHRGNAVTIEGSVEDRIEQVKNAVAQYV
ncbi:MAG: AAA family ATPase [Bacteroidetes bacterium]|nr:AAA family ATPase [Bacteroidota bacterium]